MPLKLISPGGGSAIISPTSSASNYTLTVPAVTANVVTDTANSVTSSMITSGSVTSSQLASSAVGVSQMGYSGASLQYLQWVYNTVYEYTASTNEFDLPSPLGDGTANITLSSASNRILFKAGMLCGQEDTWRGNNFRTYYSINGGSWTQVTNGGFCSIVYTAGVHGNCGMVTHEYLLPTLSTSYNVRFKITEQGHASGNYLHLNQNNISNDSTARNTVQGCSYIILQEIKA